MPPLSTGDNKIINGDMRIDQRNNGALVTATNVYTVDRWMLGASQASKIQCRQVAAGLTIGFGYVLQFTSLSAYASLAADSFWLGQFIEADMVSDFAWGTASAQPVTLSFWANSTLTGTFGGSIQNYAGTRSYPFTYSIPVANTWTKIAVTIPGDTAGTWVLQGNAGSMTVLFDLGTGSTKRGPAGAWASANYQGATGAVSVVGTNAAVFNVTGVKLETGSVATPFNRQSLAKSMADCQRYYSSISAWMYVSATAGAGFGQTITLPVTMRAAPTITFANPIYANASGIAVSVSSSSSPGINAVATGTAAASFNSTMNASAEL
jgi:hypothetical protein